MDNTHHNMSSQMNNFERESLNETESNGVLDAPQSDFQCLSFCNEPTDLKANSIFDSDENQATNRIDSCDRFLNLNFRPNDFKNRNSHDIYDSENLRQALFEESPIQLLNKMQQDSKKMDDFSTNADESLLKNFGLMLSPKKDCNRILKKPSKNSEDDLHSENKLEFEQIRVRESEVYVPSESEESDMNYLLYKKSRNNLLSTGSFYFSKNPKSSQTTENRCESIIEETNDHQRSQNVSNNIMNLEIRENQEFNGNQDTFQETQQNGNHENEQELNYEYQENEFSRISEESQTKKSMIDFDIIQTILLNIWLNQTDYLDQISKLNEFEMKILEIIIVRTHLTKKEQKKFTTEKPNLRTIIQKTEKKRNEEIFKLIYKPFLKKGVHNYKKILKKNKSLIKKLTQKRIFIESNLLNDTRKAYFLENFLPIMRLEESLNVDLIMDICNEICKLSDAKRNIYFERENNWRTVGKMRAMKKISGAFRYLMTRCEPFKKKFVKYLDDTESRKGLAKSHSRLIIEKIKKKIQSWKAIYREKNNDAASFLECLKEETQKNKFKFPWTLSGLLKGIKKTRDDFGSPKIEQEFEIIAEQHYSIRRNILRLG